MSTENSSLPIIWQSSGEVTALNLVLLSEETLPLVMGLEKPERLLLQIILGLNFVIGGLYRLLVLRMIKKQGAFRNPMNIIIALDESIRMVGYSVWILLILVVITLNHPIQSHAGIVFCYLSQYISAFGVTYGFVGGTGIALIRLIYIKYPQFAVGRKKTLVLTVTGVTALLSAVLTVLYENGHKRVGNMIDFCHGRPNELVLTLFHLKHGAAGFNIQVHCVIWFGYFVALTEMVCYFSIWKLMTKHDLTMSKILPIEKIRKRTRRHVIDLTGHATIFIFELGFLVSFSIFGPLLPDRYKFVSRCLSMSSYGVCAIVNFAFSDIMHSEVSQMMDVMAGDARKTVGFFKFVKRSIW